jgi:hypothetical protein
MSERSDVPPRPQEQLPVPLFDGVVLAVRSADGQIYLGLRDLCLTLGLDPSSQRRRITTDEALHLVVFRVLVDRQFRSLDFLLLDDVPIWILSVQQRRVAPEVRERFGYVKSYLVDAVRRAFSQITGLPEAPSNTIEDLRDLDRIDLAFSQLAELSERQTDIEHSQDRARVAYRDLAALVRELRERIQQLEQVTRQRLSATQRGTIYQLVQQWGNARAAATAGLTPGTAIRKCWAELSARFGVSTYTDLPAARYDEIVQFVKNQYEALTGRTLDAAEQQGLAGLEE